MKATNTTSSFSGEDAPIALEASKQAFDLVARLTWPVVLPGLKMIALEWDNGA
jgi:hypothetical protein